MDHGLKPYMVFSRSAGPGEVAILVFAHTVREARKVGWAGCGNEITDEYIDFAANLIRKAPWLNDDGDQEKLKEGIAHVVWMPKSCSHCECWGQSQIGMDGLCEDCRTDLNRDHLSTENHA